jgi:RNA polymerase sigma factor (sigma-70 family)
MQANDFIHLVQPVKDKLFRLAKRLLISVEEAEDATQEVILKLWKQKDKLHEYTSVEAMAVTMTKNYCLDQLKSKRANNMSLVHSNYTDNTASLERKIEGEDTWHWVEKIIQTLPEQQKMVFQLREIEGHEYSEIAKMLDMSETNVRVTLSRVRKMIKENIDKKHHYGTT